MSQNKPSFFEHFPEFRTVALEAVDALKVACESAGDWLLKAADALARTRVKVEAAPPSEAPAASPNA